MLKKCKLLHFIPILDLDECHNDLNYCHKLATCTNERGTYTCKCKTGYVGDGFDCYHSYAGEMCWKKIEIQFYSSLCLTNLGLSLARNVGKAAKRKFGVRNSILNRKLAFFSNYKKHFWASYQSQKIVLEDWFFIFFLDHVKCIPYVTTEFKFYHTFPEVPINIPLSTSLKWTSFPF